LQVTDTGVGVGSAGSRRVSDLASGLATFDGMLRFGFLYDRRRLFFGALFDSGSGTITASSMQLEPSTAKALQARRFGSRTG
jgi:hypothetical protein